MPISRLPLESAPINSNYNSTFAITWDIGVVMVMLAVAGGFNQNFLGLHLSFMHSLVLASFGVLAIWSGMTTQRLAYISNLFSGLFFLASTILGFLLGDRGHLKLGYGSSEDLIVKLAPSILELSLFDHVLHFGLALFFLLVAYSWKSRFLDFPDNMRTH